MVNVSSTETAKASGPWLVSVWFELRVTFQTAWVGEVYERPPESASV